MDDNEELIEEARRAYLDAWAATNLEDVPPVTRSRNGIIAALAVFEKARTPTDDKREVDALCGDWPAPCNCDDPETHDGSVPRWLVQEERRIEPHGEPPKLARRLLAQGFSEGVNFIDDQPGPWGAAVVAGRAEAARRVAAAGGVR